MKKLVVSMVSAAALATAGMAAANNGMAASDQSFSSGNNASGVFVSGDAGVGFVGLKKSDFNDPITNAAPTQFQTHGFAWAANLGYQFNKYLALEAGYMTFGKTKVNTTIGGIAANETDSFGGFDAAAKVIAPISSQFNLFAKAGAVDMHDDADLSVVGRTIRAHGSTWVPMLGLGTSYNVSNNVALTVQDDYAFRTNYTHQGVKTFMPAANDVLAGLSYKFNV